MSVALNAPQETVSEISQMNADSNKPITQRLYSLDALRGFDMFWIMGAEEVFHGFAKAGWVRHRHIN